MLHTAAQRRELCKNCPVAKVADLVGDTQSILIIRDLMLGPQRFCDMEKSLGMSTRTLTLKLQHLQKSGFVRHTDGSPYALTTKGKAFKPVMDSLRRYGEKYL